ncbi:MAG: GIY-YIG nuclease family protein [Candidatus Helarchaeota archaeon]
MNYLVYILKSKTDGSFYIGYTSNIKKRLEEHNSGRSYYTRRKIPWDLVYKEEFKTKKEAIMREKQLKSKKSHRFIELLIKELP